MGVGASVHSSDPTEVFETYIRASKVGDFPILADIVNRWKNEECFLETPNSEGDTALHLATRARHFKIMGLIAKASVTSTKSYNRAGELPIHVACKRAHAYHYIRKLLQASPATVKMTTKSANETPFHMRSEEHTSEL